MIKKKLFRDRQEARAGDFNEPQDFTQTSFDTLVADAITDDARYKGMTVTMASNTEVAISAGRLYNGGRMYDRTVSTNKSLIADLPVSQKRIVTVVAFGQTVQTDVEPRDFLIDLETGATEPQAVAMTEVRKAEIGYLTSSESVAPTPPAIASGQVKVADIVLTPTGIETITMSAETELGGLEGANANIRGLTTWRQTISPRVDALQSTLADVRGALRLKAESENVASVEKDMLALWSVLGLPPGVSGRDIDGFDDADKSDDAFETDEAYQLTDGVFFPSADDMAATLDLFNPIDSTVSKSGDGWLLPAHTNEAAIATADPTGTLNLSSYSSQTRTVKRFGWTYGLWATGTRWIHNRRLNERYYGTTFLTRNAGSEGWYYAYQRRHSYLRRVGYSSREVVNTTNYTGMTLAQTILSPRAMWITSIGLNFSGLDASGDLTLLITKVDKAGKPITGNTISETSVPYANLSASGETQVTIEPAFIEAGERLAIVLVTNGSHQHRTVTGVEDTQGVIYYGDGTGWQHTEDGRSLLFTLYAARFGQTTTEVRLGDINLAGGITDLTITAEEVAPAGTEVAFEYQYNGVWYPLDEADQLVTQTPSTVPLRAVFTGTTTLQPAFKTGAGKVAASISAASLIHYSTVIALPAASSEVYVELDLNWWDDAEDTIQVDLLDADDGDAVIASDSATAVEVTPILEEDGTTPTGMEDRRMRFAFTPTAIENFRIKITGSTTGNGDRPFGIAERIASWVI
ncbi:MAG: hypothetical protein LC676_10665 [Loktanella sp.]|nr:hypothetical protein [Loktanella sp.]